MLDLVKGFCVMAGPVDDNCPHGHSTDQVGKLQPDRQASRQKGQRQSLDLERFAHGQAAQL